MRRTLKVVLRRAADAVFARVDDRAEVEVRLDFVRGTLQSLVVDGQQTELLAKRCEELGILSTGSADFHGPDHKAFAKFLDFETYGHEPNLGPIAS